MTQAVALLSRRGEGGGSRHFLCVLKRFKVFSPKAHSGFHQTREKKDEKFPLGEKNARLFYCFSLLFPGTAPKLPRASPKGPAAAAASFGANSAGLGAADPRGVGQNPALGVESVGFRLFEPKRRLLVPPPPSTPPHPPRAGIYRPLSAPPRAHI